MKIKKKHDWELREHPEGVVKKTTNGMFWYQEIPKSLEYESSFHIYILSLDKTSIFASTDKNDDDLNIGVKYIQHILVGAKFKQGVQVIYSDFGTPLIRENNSVVIERVPTYTPDEVEEFIRGAFSFNSSVVPSSIENYISSLNLDNWKRENKYNLEVKYKKK